MENIEIAGTKTSPEIHMDFSTGVFRMSGESYSEESSQILSDVCRNLETYLADNEASTVEFSFALQYFNSSSTRGIMRIVSTLDAAAGSGRSVVINWHYRSFDEDLEEFGEEFGEDIEHAKFAMIEDPES